MIHYLHMGLTLETKPIQKVINDLFWLEPFCCNCSLFLVSNKNVGPVLDFFVKDKVFFFSHFYIVMIPDSVEPLWYVDVDIQMTKYKYKCERYLLRALCHLIHHFINANATTKVSKITSWFEYGTVFVPYTQ